MAVMAPTFTLTNVGQPVASKAVFPEVYRQWRGMLEANGGPGVLEENYRTTPKIILKEVESLTNFRPLQTLCSGAGCYWWWRSTRWRG